MTVVNARISWWMMMGWGTMMMGRSILGMMRWRTASRLVTGRATRADVKNKRSTDPSTLREHTYTTPNFLTISPPQPKQKRRGINHTMDDSTMKKARMVNALAASTETAAKKSDGSLWGFVSKTGAAQSIGQTTTKKVNLEDQLDSLLDAQASKKKAAPAKRAAAGRPSAARPAPRGRPGARPGARPTAATATDMDEGDDAPTFFGNDDADNDAASMDDAPPPSDSNKLNFSGEEPAAAADSSPAAPARSRSRFAKAKVIQPSAQTESSIAAISTVSASEDPTDFGAPGLKASSTTVDAISSEGTATTPAALAAANANFASIATADAAGNKSIDMFWLDAFEKKGVVYLFGKVKVSGGEYVSCCAVVTGNERNMFVLPRKMAGSEERVGFGAVHADLKAVLQPKIVPNGNGNGFKVKKAVRKYAFDVEGVPREPTEYLKVKYKAEFVMPPSEVCTEGTENIERIFGGNTKVSALRKP